MIECEGEIVVDESLQSLNFSGRNASLNSFLKDVLVDWSTQVGQGCPIRDGMDHFQDFGVMFDLSQTKMRQHSLLDDGTVEVAAGNIHTAAGIDLAFLGITQSHHGDIECTAAEVKDDDILRLCD